MQLFTIVILHTIECVSAVCSGVGAGGKELLLSDLDDNGVDYDVRIIPLWIEWYDHMTSYVRIY